jgi:allantoate deiminase
VYANTLEYFARAFGDLGFEIHHDPVGTMVASNRGPGERCFGLGSHCDSNRNGGRYDGTMGVVAALEACRLAADRGLDLPFRVISFLEEEGSGFGQMLLGSRIMLQRVSDEELESYRDDDGRSFPEAARAAGYEPERHRESIHQLDELVGWIELHIEQGRVLQDTGNRIGIVDAIAGYVHADMEIVGRDDHAGATPMGFRSDAAVTAGECIVELERLTRELSDDAVGTVGELRLEPNLINVIPGSARFSLDLRSASGDHLEVRERIVAYAQERAREREQRCSFEERQRLEPTPMDQGVVGALERLAQQSGEPYRRMPSGAAHDTMNVAQRVPSAMLFVPCRDGISHAPDEHAEPADAALAARLMLEAAEELL